MSRNEMLQAWRETLHHFIQMFPLIHLWMNFGDIFKDFLLNFLIQPDWFHCCSHEFNLFLEMLRLAAQWVQDDVHCTDNMCVDKFWNDDKDRNYDCLVSVSRDHIVSIKNTNRVPNRKTICKDYSMIVKMIVLSDNIRERQPHSIPFCIIEPGTGLPMNIYHKVKYKLKEPQR